MEKHSKSVEIETMQTNLKFLRGQRDLSFEDLSRQTGIAPGDLDRLENGDANVDVEYLLKLCDIYGVHPSKIFLSRGEQLLHTPNP